MQSNPFLSKTVLLGLVMILGFAEASRSEPENILKNPGFEEGTPGQVPSGWVEWKGNASTFLIDSDGREGGQCAKIVFQPGKECTFVLADQYVWMKPLKGERYQASCWVRADEPTPVAFFLYGGTHTEGKSRGIALMKRVDVTADAEWTKVTAELDIPDLATGVNPHLRINVGYGGKSGTTVYVDDTEIVRIRDADRLPERAAVVKEAAEKTGPTLLKNAGFEQGALGDSPTGWVKWTRNPSKVLTAPDGRTGKQCAEVTLVKNKACSFVLLDQTVIMPLEQGQRYRADCFVRGVEPTRVTLWLCGGTATEASNEGISVVARADALVGQSWSQVSVELDIPELATGVNPYLRFAFARDVDGPAVYVDDAQLVQLPSDRIAKGSANLLKNPDFEEGAELPAFGGVFEADQYEITRGLPFEMYGRPIGASTTITFRLPDDVGPSLSPAAFLWLWADDFDSPEEVGVYVNGKGPAYASGALIGEGPKDHKGYVPINASFLTWGTNSIAFAFEDTVGGTTEGFGVLAARLLLVRPAEALPASKVKRGGGIKELTIPSIGTLVVTEHLPATLPMHRGRELGWKAHPIRKGDGKGGWTYIPGEHQLIVGKFDAGIMPFGLAQMDNGEVILAASDSDGEKEIPVFAFSKDRGDTWSDWHTVPETGGKPGSGRPMMLTYLGKGNLFFHIHEHRWFSKDYGRTWLERVGIPGPAAWNEGNNLVEFDADGNVKAVAEVVCHLSQDDGSAWDATKPSNLFFRWSYDGGRTWTTATRPEAWRYEETYKGKTYRRSASEGGLARAKNGWLVAAIRTDMPAWLAVGPNNDGVEGTGVSISKDDGATWSPVEERIIFPAGRHHSNLVVLPNGDLVMTVIVRNDIREGELASYQRGCEAVVSRDNGLTWDVAGKYVLDEYKYLSADKWFDGKCGHLYTTMLDDGSLLTAYGNYLAKAAVLIRWKVE